MLYRGIFFLSALCIVLFPCFGCGGVPNPAGSETPGLVADGDGSVNSPTGEKTGRVTFRLVLPGEKQRADVSTFPATRVSPEIRAQEIPPRVTFKLTLINVGDASQTTTVLSQTTPVVNREASATFPAVPCRPVVGELLIEGGNVEGNTEFHGAGDIVAGQLNVIEVAPKNSRLAADVKASLLLRLIADPVQFKRMFNGIVNEISTVLTGMTLDVAGINDLAYSRFLGWVDAVPHLSVVAGNRSVVIAWDPVAGAQSYNLYFSPNPSGFPVRGVSSPFTLQGLSMLEDHSFWLTAVTGAAESSPSAKITVRPALPPQNFAVLSGTETNTITWIAEPFPVTYVLYWTDTSAADLTANGRVVEFAQTPYVHSGLEPGKTYYYALKANLGNGSTPFTETRTGVPSGWNCTRDGDGIITHPLTGQRWREGPDRDMSWNTSQAWISSLGPDWRIPKESELQGLYKRFSTRKNHLDPAFLLENAWYVWSVSENDLSARYFHFLDGHGESVLKETMLQNGRAFAVSGIGSPRNLRAVGGLGTIALFWDTDNGFSYDVHWSISSGGAFQSGNHVQGASPGYQLQNPATGTVHFFTVTATKDGEVSQPCAEVPARSLVPPAVPANLRVTPSEWKVTLDWDHPPEITSFNAYWLDNEGVTPQNGQVIAKVSPPLTIPFNDVSRKYFVVTALSDGLESQPTQVVEAKPLAPAPLISRVTEGSGTVALEWTTAVNFDSFVLYWSKEAGVTPRTGNRIPVQYRAYQHDGLENGRGYHYVVTGIQAGVESGPSVEVTATPTSGLRFSIDGNGVITDSKKGNQWLSGADIGKVTWEEGQAWVASLSLFHGGGWRTPTTDELKELYVSGAPPGCRIDAVFNMGTDSEIWSTVRDETTAWTYLPELDYVQYEARTAGELPSPGLPRCRAFAVRSAP